MQTTTGYDTTATQRWKKGEMTEKESVWSVVETQMGTRSDRTSADRGVSGTQYKHSIHAYARTHAVVHPPTMLCCVA